MNQYQVPILPEYKSMYVDMGLSEIATIERERYDKASAENDQLTRTMGSIRLLNGDKQVITRISSGEFSNFDKITDSPVFVDGILKR